MEEKENPQVKKMFLRAANHVQSIMKKKSWHPDGATILQIFVKKLARKKFKKYFEKVTRKKGNSND